MKDETINLVEFLKDMNITRPSKDRDLLDLFYDAETIFKGDKLPYEFIESVNQRGDGSGYETFWVFKRKSDGKFFYFYSYDGRVEDDTLEETKQEVKTTWDFECQY